MTTKKKVLMVAAAVLAVVVVYFVQPKLLVGLPIVGMALAADRLTVTKDRGLKAYPVKGSACIYDGAMVCLDSSGFAIPAADAASNRVVGIARGRADNSGSATDGAINVYVESPVIAKFAATSITQAMVGQMMYVVDDQTFDDTIGTNAVKAGRLVEYVSNTEGWIEVDKTWVGAKTADADATYGQPEADLINELKNVVNKGVS